MADMTRIFLHGLESSSRGRKAQFFRQNFGGMLTPDFTGDLNNRLARLREILQDTTDLIMVGSSFGGLMAAIYGLEYPDKVKKLILLAPALNFPDFSAWQGRTSHIPTALFIGRHDTVTPPGPVVDAAGATFTNLTVSLLDDDHLLSKSFLQLDWPALLQNPLILPPL
jgi:pimeloyl-ACP methyl ester carboxylesterase